MPSQIEREDKLEELWTEPPQTGRFNPLPCVWLFSAKLKKVFDHCTPETEAQVALSLVGLLIVTVASLLIQEQMRVSWTLR